MAKKIRSEEFSLAETCQLAWGCRAMGISQGNLPKLVRNGTVRRVKIPAQFSKHERIPISDIVAYLKNEHQQICIRKEEIERHLAHLGEVVDVYHELYKENPNAKNADIQRLVNEFQN